MKNIIYFPITTKQKQFNRIVNKSNFNQNMIFIIIFFTLIKRRCKKRVIYKTT